MRLGDFGNSNFIERGVNLMRKLMNKVLDAYTIIISGTQPARQTTWLYNF